MLHRDIGGRTTAGSAVVCRSQFEGKQGVYCRCWCNKARGCSICVAESDGRPDGLSPSVGRNRAIGIGGATIQSSHRTFVH